MNNLKSLMTQLQEHFEVTDRPQYAGLMKALSEQPWKDRLLFSWERYNTVPFSVLDEDGNSAIAGLVVSPTIRKDGSLALKLIVHSVADDDNVVYDDITLEEIVAVVESWIM